MAMDFISYGGNACRVDARFCMSVCIDKFEILFYKLIFYAKDNNKT